jgi:hypothetical protein
MDASRLIKPANRKSPTRQTVPLPDVNGHHDDPTADHAFFSVFPQQDVEATKGLEPSGSWSAQDKAALDLVNDVMHHLHGTGDARPKFGSLEGEALISAKMDRAYARQKSWLISDDNDSKTTRLAQRQHWAVDYMSAGEMVKMGLVETYILQHFGRQARRIWKALDEKGKMEEKQVSDRYIPTRCFSITDLISCAPTADRETGYASCQRHPRGRGCSIKSRLHHAAGSTTNSG